MNKSLRISRLQLGTIGAVCCIVGIRILLGIGSPLPSETEVELKPLQIQQQPEELLDDLIPLDVQSIQIPNTNTDTLGPLPSQLDNLLNLNRSLQ